MCKISRHQFLLFLGAAGAAAALTGCGTSTSGSSSAASSSAASAGASSFNPLDSGCWNYNAEDDVYWQIQLPYCSAPVDLTYETLGIFVPGGYMDAVSNEDGTYTCTVHTDGSVGGYTALDAPIVIPVDTPGYAAMAAPTDYVSDAADFTNAGFIYFHPGCRGRDAGAPSGLVDLKAAVRWLRCNTEHIPGNTDRIFTFGMSGGGAQSTLMGVSGDSDLYTPYLEAIGAAEGVSDAVFGSMAWCPVTSLDYADEAYEWNMGCTRSDLDPEMQKLSDGMALAFAEHIQTLGLTGPDGSLLTLTESETGIWQAGSYYDYLLSEVERSLNNFLEDTTFPYTSGGSDAGGRGPGGPAGELPEGEGMNAGGYVDANGEFQNDGINRTDTGSTQTESKTYQTAQEYIDDLNADETWITYDSASNTATVSSMMSFVSHCKKASKNVGAFDDLDRTQGENILFGYGDGEGAHFDPIMAELLSGTEYGDAFAEDLARTDALGTDVQTRVLMYSPLYYLLDSYDGCGTANVAKYWRIRTGITQGDTALTTEVNLALALRSYGGTQVDFETVWEQAHTMAERTGNSTENFIAWVNDCLAAEA